MTSVRIKAVANGYMAVEDYNPQNPLLEGKANVFTNLDDLFDWLEENLDEPADRQKERELQQEVGPLPKTSVVGEAQASPFRTEAYYFPPKTSADPTGANEAFQGILRDMPDNDGNVQCDGRWVNCLNGKGCNKRIHPALVEK